MCRSIPVMCLGLFISGCARPPAPVAPQAQIKRELPVICRLVSREQTVTISAGPNGSVYSVQDSAGKTLLSYASGRSCGCGIPTSRINLIRRLWRTVLSCCVPSKPAIKRKKTANCRLRLFIILK